MYKKLIFLLFLAAIGVLGVVALPQLDGQTIALDQPDPYPWLDQSAGAREGIRPLPTDLVFDQATVSLGERLFHDPRLSGNGNMSCAVCHSLSHAGADGLPRSVMVNGGTDEMNTPTVFNSGFNFSLLWNGRFDTLEEQIEGVIHSPKHMGSNWDEILERLEADASYVSSFNAIYPDGLRPDNIKHAIATFERSLVTPNAPFDRFLNGDREALDEDEQAGYRLFQAYGCIACHQGINIGGNIFAPLGVFKPYFANHAQLSETDLGRYAVTSQERDRHVFRVPSLRNVARTAPYFHDGSRRSLTQAVIAMGEYQLGRRIPPGDVALIVNFLHTLTGEYKGRSL